MSDPQQPASERVPIPGSERTPLPGATTSTAIDPTSELQVSVYVRPRKPITPEVVAEQARHGALSREKFAERFGARDEDLEAVEAFGSDYGLSVVESDPARRVVRLTGGAAALNEAFGVELTSFDHPDGSYRGHQGPVTVPAELGDVITGVHGLDDRPQAQPRLVVATHASAPGAAGPYSPVAVAEAYDFPTTSDGSGECVAILELGGGYEESDLSTFFSNNGITEPTVVAVGVDGGANTPGGDADGEVALDIEIIGAVAPGARIAVYFAPNTDQGFIDAVTTAANDATNKPSVISISWGSAESTWAAQSMQTMDQAFQSAALMGVTVFVASGDSGSSDGVTDGLAHADFPASSPNAVGCGGTTLSATGGTIKSEVVWDSDGNASGGGISDVFAVPSYQSAAGVPPSANPGGRVGRGVPDVSGNADPATGYEIVLGGTTQTFGGTSAVAPLWAGLMARINADVGAPAGLINARLYADPGAFHDITEGTNGSYTAGPGWDACTGLGSPDGLLVEGALKPTS
jgi:kumamolisin